MVRVALGQLDCRVGDKRANQQRLGEAIAEARSAGADLLVPAASPTVTPGIEGFWRELTRFYARMLECYVVFVNRVGTEGAFRFWGGSHVVDPAGDIVAEIRSDEEAVVVAELDLDRVE